MYKSNRFNKLKVKIIKRRKESHTKQKAKVEKGVHNNNKNVTEGKKMLKRLIGFHSTNKIVSYNRRRKMEKKKSKNLQNKSKHKKHSVFHSH